MKGRKKLIIFTGVLLAVVAFFIFRVKFQPNPVMALPTVSAVKGDISSKITALGRVETVQEQEVYSPIQGTVEFVVEEGQWLIFNFKNDETMVNQSIADADPVESIHLVYEKFMH